MSEKILIIDHGKCTGCIYCMLICSMIHENFIQRSKSRLKVYKFENEVISIPMICEHCEDPPCVHICPVEAINKSQETRTVSMDVEKCTGCRECMKACPYYAIQFDPERNVAFICDLCGGEPTCAKVCIQGAIEWVDSTPAMVVKKKAAADARVEELERALEAC